MGNKAAEVTANRGKPKPIFVGKLRKDEKRSEMNRWIKREKEEEFQAYYLRVRGEAEKLEAAGHGRAPLLRGIIGAKRHNASQ